MSTTNSKITEKTSVEEKEKTLAGTKGLQFTFNGEKYKFVSDAPKYILWEGSPLTQEEIVKNDYALATLIGKKFSIITKIK